jgi:hypothetical protein
MLDGQWPGIAAWSTNKCLPKGGDDFQVIFPIVDLRLKY